MAVAIKIENLGKKYALGRQREQGYVALRDVLAEGAKKLLRPHQLLKRNVREDFWALKDINLEVQQGDKMAIIGHNGAGKSTLLKILSRITDPTEGRVELHGRVASLLEVGTGFHPELTGRENIFLNGSVLGMSQAEVRRKFDEIVDFAGVEKFLDTPVKRYSSGMRMRLGFAVAAHLESEILIIDEVLAVGDAAFQKKCLGKMDEVSRSEGRTILFVSHHMAAVRQLCSKGIVLEKGALKAQGSIQKITESYLKTNIVNTVRYQVNDGIDFIGLKNADDFKHITSQPTLRFLMEFKNTTGHVLADLLFDFAIFNAQNDRVCHLSSSYLDRYFAMQPGTNILQLEVNNPLLSAGDYSVSFSFRQQSQQFMLGHHAFSFTVELETYPVTGIALNPLVTTTFMPEFKMEMKAC